MSSDLDAMYRSRMLGRIRQMEGTVAEHLPTTQALFSATAAMQETLRHQREDAQQWAALLEEGTESQEALAEELIDYSHALDAALDSEHPAPHYQASVSALDQRLDPDQMDTVLGSEAIQHCADASLENALYSGQQLLTSGTSADHPFIYREHKQDWDRACSAAEDGSRLWGYTPMAPVREEVESVMSDTQLIEHQQRQIETAMASHMPTATQPEVDVLERQAVELYAAPMIAPSQSEPGQQHIQATLNVDTHFTQQQDHGPSLG